METFDCFLERMSQVESIREMTVGRAHQGNTRAIFNFEGAVCCLESRNYRTLPPSKSGHSLAQAFWMVMGPEPRDYWWTTWALEGRGLANQIAKHYGGRIEEVYYPPETGSWWFFKFDQFENLIKLVYDRKVSGQLYKRFPGAAMHEEAESE